MTTTTSNFARLACAALAAAATVAGAEPGEGPGAMLRHGNWNQYIGSYQVPSAWRERPTRSWPMDGWALFVIDAKAATMSVQPLAAADARRQLKPILDQVELAKQETKDEPASAPPGTANQTFVRVPGLAWQARTVTLYRFRNGTPRLVPAPGHRYELELAGKPFAFTVRSERRAPDLVATRFSLEVDGQRHDYDLSEHGQGVRIEAVGDFDGDGQPDFVFSLGGVDIASEDGSDEALVLSSQARPGRNPPTAALFYGGQ